MPSEDDTEIPAVEETVNDAIDALTADDFDRAFRAISRSANDDEMLRVHYDAPDRIITATQLARGLGFNVFGAANLHYGRLARRVGEVLGVRPKPLLYVLVEMEKPDNEWLWIMRKPVAKALERLGIVDGYSSKLAEELPPNEALVEGAAYHLTVNAYERNSVARKKCVDHYGAACVVCGFEFGRVFGSTADGFIHVHHLRMLSSIGEEYVIDPVTDLVPVCPNCHAVIHLRNPPYSLHEVRAMIGQPRDCQ